MGEKDAEKALYTVLKTEFADHLLLQGMQHYLDRKWPWHKNAKCLIVCTNIAEAKRHIRSLKNFNLRSAIATSEDSGSAIKNINKMKADKLDVLVTVAMAYEGLSIPEVSHIICLTQIRSTPWIEQMTARANRIDPVYPYDEQIGHIFAPADPLFKAVMEKIEKEQAPVLQQRMKSEREKSDGNGQTTIEGITPLASALTGKREIILKGARKSVMGIPITEQIQTASEREADLLGKIDDHIGEYSYNNRMEKRKLNAEVFNHFGKSRRQMTIKELETCLAHVRQVYPLSFVRGTGQPRVSTKATPLKAVWR
jgi:type I site-specific restriction endonuclease